MTLAALAVLGALLHAKALPCAFAHVFHTPCPGCGSTRSVLALVGGDLAGVVRYNPLGPVMALFVGIVAVQSLVSVLVHGDFRDAAEGRIGYVVKRGIVVVASLELLLWSLRFCGAFGGPVPI